MEWKKPACSLCKKAIERPAEAIYVACSLRGDIYQHVECHTKNMAAFVSDFSGAGVAAAAATGSVIGALAAKNTMEDLSRNLNSGKRSRIQNQAAKNFMYGIGGGILMAALGGAALIGAKKETGLFVLASAAGLFLLGIGILAANIIAIKRRKELEALIKSGKQA